MNRGRGEGHQGVIDGGGRGMLGGEPVLQRQHGHVGRAGQLAADGVVRGQAAQHEPAAVQVDDQRPRARRGPVQPGGQVTDDQVPDQG
jgi:hypothetical protein